MVYIIAQNNALETKNKHQTLHQTQPTINNQQSTKHHIPYTINHKLTTIKPQKKIPDYIRNRGFLKKLAATYSPAFAVPSALEGLTSVFGMGTGEPLC